MKLHRQPSMEDIAASGLFEAVAVIKTGEEAEHFLMDLCTPAEIQAMADRWRVVALLKQGIPYRQIYEKTGVSVTTIGRVARSLSMGEGGYNMIFQRIENKKNVGKTKIKNRGPKKWPAK